LRDFDMAHVVKNEKDLDWLMRKSIISSVVYGLEFLHKHNAGRYDVSNENVDHVKDWKFLIWYPWDRDNNNLN
jgi:hypothetical protein